MVTSRGEATRTRILDAATDQLTELGKHGFLLDSVLRATSTSKSQLFHYFPGGKDELLEAAVHRQIERLLARSQDTSRFDSWESWQAWVERTAQLHRRQLATSTCEIAALAARAVDADSRSRRLASGAYEALIDAQARGLESMQRRGMLTEAADPRSLAALVVCTLQGGAIIDQATASRTYLVQALDMALTHLKSYGLTPASPAQ